jgi:hypothetical protein
VAFAFFTTRLDVLAFRAMCYPPRSRLRFVDVAASIRGRATTQHRTHSIRSSDEPSDSAVWPVRAAPRRCGLLRFSPASPSRPSLSTGCAPLLRRHLLRHDLHGTALRLRSLKRVRERHQPALIVRWRTLRMFRDHRLASGPARIRRHACGQVPRGIGPRLIREEMLERVRRGIAFVEKCGEAEVQPANVTTSPPSTPRVSGAE